MAEVPERDQAERLQGGRRAGRRRPHGQGDRADRRARRRLRGGAVRRAAARARATRSWRSSSATSPTSATTRSSRRPRRPSGCPTDAAGARRAAAPADERARRRRGSTSPTERLADGERAALPDPRERRRLRASTRSSTGPSAFARSTPTARCSTSPAASSCSRPAGRTTRRGRRRARSPRTSSYARLDALARPGARPAPRRVHDPRPAARLGPRHRADPRREPAPDDLGGRRAARPGRLDGGAADDRGVPAAARRSTATSTSRAASASIGKTLCINPGSEANHGILRGYLVDIGPDGIELALRVEG